MKTPSAPSTPYATKEFTSELMELIKHGSPEALVDYAREDSEGGGDVLIKAIELRSERFVNKLICCDFFSMPWAKDVLLAAAKKAPDIVMLYGDRFIDESYAGEVLESVSAMDPLALLRIAMSSKVTTLELFLKIRRAILLHIHEGKEEDIGAYSWQVPAGSFVPEEMIKAFRGMFEKVTAPRLIYTR